MRQYAWLDFHGGHWHLITGIVHDHVRRWTNRERGLSDLTAEGWIIDGPHGKRPTIKHDANRHFYEYALKRTVH
jgi:hypothetical protein